ncbi:heme-binding protein [Puniceibacterium sp. IMCC21224]|uniref:heme-binding protein n=1 Tax=Puniceibacterium sp. IMCC21224 TaxID=1618204 RepID=UPI0012DFF57D|nr:heme-binding protein [Puniceibacterium sp. IMCC21224]
MDEKETRMFSRATRAVTAFASLLSVTACSVFGSAAAPEPEYRVTLSDPPFEVRGYGELVVAKTPMGEGSRAAFGRLFDYISGTNTGGRDIAMTAPVLNTDNSNGSKIAMCPSSYKMGHQSGLSIGGSGSFV